MALGSCGRALGGKRLDRGGNDKAQTTSLRMTISVNVDKCHTCKGNHTDTKVARTSLNISSLTEDSYHHLEAGKHP